MLVDMARIWREEPFSFRILTMPFNSFDEHSGLGQENDP